MHEKNIFSKEIVLCFNLKNEGLRKVVSIKERNNGDLVIMPKYAEHYREPTTEPNNNIKIKQQKYSVHCSPNSKEFNVCMHNLELSDGNTIRTPQYTKTVKSNNGRLTALYYCRCPDLSIDRYKLNNKDQNKSFCLDEFDRHANTLYYGIFICSNSKKSYLSFQTGEQNYKTFKFSNFTVLFVWTYQYIPSHLSGAKIHNLSVDDQKLNDEIGEIVFTTTEGLSGIEAKKYTSRCFNSLKEELFQVLVKTDILEKKDYSIFDLPFRKTPYNFKTKGK